MEKTSRWRRRALLGAVAAAIGAGLIYGFRPQPVEIDTGLAERGDLQVSVEQEGRTRVIDRYLVTAPVPGYARRITLDAGSPVDAGDKLVELEPLRPQVPDARSRAEAQARIGAAAASVQAAEQRNDAARSEAALAQKELERIRTLRGNGYATAADVDRAASGAERSLASLRSSEFVAATARHELAAARTALMFAAAPAAASAVAVRSPVSGRVLKIAHKSEGTVAAGEPLIEIGDPRSLEVEVDLLSADAVRVGPGTPVILERWGGDTALRGEVRRVEPAGFTKVSALGVEEQRVWVIVGLTSPRSVWQRLGDGYRVEARFVVWEGRDVLHVPTSALFRDDGHWAVYVVDQERARKRRIEAGQGNGLRTQVLSGIGQGTRVVVHPDDRVREGVRIAAK